MKKTKWSHGVMVLGIAFLVAGGMLLSPAWAQEDFPVRPADQATTDSGWSQPAPVGDNASDVWAPVEQAGTQDSPQRQTGGGMPAALPWILAGVLVFLLIVVVVVIVIIMMMHSKKIREEMSREKNRSRSEVMSLRQELKRKEDEIHAAQERLQNQPKDDAGVDEEHDHTQIDDANPVLGVVLLDTKSGKTWSLNVHVADASGHIIRTPKYVVGKDGNCDVTVPEDLVSRQHCNIRADYDGRVFVVDLDSTNGTYVQRGGELVQVVGKEEIKSDDVLFLGSKIAMKACRLDVIIRRFDVSQAQ